MSISERTRVDDRNFYSGLFNPLLHGLKKKGDLHSARERHGKSIHTVYRATPLGRKALKAAKFKVRELFGELIEGD